MLASFVGNWMISNSPEYGVLGAIGANRRHLCAISAGQVLFISLLASVPVILLSAAVSNIYISVYNSISSTDVDYVFSIPWGKLIQASLWFDVLACFFTYLTVAKITREYPFILISGSFRSSYPFVKRSAYTIEKSKDKIRKISLVRAMRNIKSEVITAILTSLICIVCGAFFLVVIVVRGVAGMNLSELQDHVSDMQITVDDAYASPAELMAMGRIKRALIKQSDIDYLRSVDGVVSVGAYCEGGSKTLWPDDSGKYLTTENPTVFTDGEADTHYYVITDETVLPHFYKYVIEGDPLDLFDGDNKVIVFSRDNETTYKVGDKMELSAGYEQKRSTGKITPGETHEFTVAAVVAEQSEDFLKLGDNTFIFSFDGGEKLGYTENGEAEGLLVDLDESFTYEDITKTVDTIVNSPQILRYDVVNYTVASTQERQIEATNTLLVTMFFVMVYLSFCVMTYTSSYLKVTKMRQEIAITRQIGADNKAIYKTMRTETYPTSILAIITTFAIILLISYAYKSYSMWFLNAQADMYPITYTGEYYNEVKTGINQVALIILVLLPAALPMHLISFAVSVLGTILPTRELLKESITDGIRKDTD